MDFGADKTAIKMIKESTFGGTYFRDTYPRFDGKWCRKSW